MTWSHTTCALSRLVGMRIGCVLHMPDGKVESSSSYPHHRGRHHRLRPLPAERTVESTSSCPHHHRRHHRPILDLRPLPAERKVESTSSCPHHHRRHHRPILDLRPLPVGHRVISGRNSSMTKKPRRSVLYFIILTRQANLRKKSASTQFGEHVRQADPDGHWVMCRLCPGRKQLRMRTAFCTGNWKTHKKKKALHVRHGLKGTPAITSFFAKAVRSSASSTNRTPASMSSNQPPTVNSVVVSRVYSPEVCHGGVPNNLNPIKVELLQLLPMYGHPSKLEGLKIVKTSDSDRVRVHSTECLRILTATNRRGNKNLPHCCKVVGPCFHNSRCSF